jgi:hypothetical protein|tara:strand:- start:817 stop:2004 length:1188 start_codon:yes stop_codon:yes gene_type:complete
MKKIILVLFPLIISFNTNAQFFKNVYKDFLKYGTFYAAGNIANAKLETSDYFIRTNPEDLYAIPNVIDETTYHPFDYRYGIGIRKLARFGYESKPNFYNGTENNVGLSAPTAAVKGLEYLLHWEKERVNGDKFTNKRLFVRHTGKYHIAKFETRESGKVGFEYTSGELRARLPIGKKFSVSLGAIYRTHQKPYGYNPIEIWLNETFINPETNLEEPLNPWYSLGYFYGFTDEPTTYTNEYTGDTFFDWIWRNERGEIVAYGDRDFRDRIFGNLMNRFNEEVWEGLDAFAEVAPIAGFDFYHYKNNFWLHAYGNWILPYHKYVSGEQDFTYLNRNNWGKGGLKKDSSLEQWDDYQAGLMFGWKVTKSLGIFIEGEYTKFWDSKIYQTNFGINLTLK